MFIIICGGVCAGKKTVADWLNRFHGFSRLHIHSSGSKHANAGAKRHLVRDIALQSDSADEVLDFITVNYARNFVTTDIQDEHTIERLLQRPFCLLVRVDAPVSVRWRRLKARCAGTEELPPSLEDFVIQNDEQLYRSSTGLEHMLDRAQLRLLNAGESQEALYDALRQLDLPNPQRLRPSWDQYFMQLASLAAQRSNCMKRRVGCVLVRDRRVISTGYNGTPRFIKNCNEGGCARCNNAGPNPGDSLTICLCIHAEENALLEAGRERIREGTSLYCDTCPCLTCSIKIAQVGISEVVYSKSYSMDVQTAAVLKEAGVKLRQFSPPRNGLVDLSFAEPTENEGG